MPVTSTLGNTSVLKIASENVSWRMYTAKAFAESVPKGAYDIRHISDISCVLFDAETSKEKRDAYFYGELQKMAEAFSTTDPKTGKPYPEAILPYIKDLFERATYDDAAVDWDNVKDVENVLATMKASQALATLVRDFPDEILHLYPSGEAIARMDAISAKTSLLYLKLRTFMSRNPEILDAAGDLALGRDDRFDTAKNDLTVNLGTAIFDARLAGRNVVTIDPSQDELMIQHFMSKSFETEILGGTETYDDVEYAKDFMAAIGSVYLHTSMEQIPTSLIGKGADVDHEDYQNLYINGKSVSAIIVERASKKGINGFSAQREVAKLFRDALTDGKSVVTLMQSVISAEGKTEFRHQEIKVDLDKLNAIDKERGNYSRFRRFLDRRGWWKIQKFPSNKSRDAKQERVKESADFKSSIRAAEDTYINNYNGEGVQRLSDRLLKSIPKLTRVEKTEQKEQDVQRVETHAPDREPFPVQLDKLEPKLPNASRVESENKVSSKGAIDK